MTEKWIALRKYIIDISDNSIHVLAPVSLVQKYPGFYKFELSSEIFSDDMIHADAWYSVDAATLAAVLND